MDQHTFNTELAKYARVRDSHWHLITPSKHFTQRHLDAATAVESKTVEPEYVPVPEQVKVVEKIGDFITSFRALLEKYYSKDKVEKIIHVFLGNYKKALDNLSLDDVERIAIKFDARTQ